MGNPFLVENARNTAQAGRAPEILDLRAARGFAPAHFFEPQARSLFRRPELRLFEKGNFQNSKGELFTQPRCWNPKGNPRPTRPSWEGKAGLNHQNPDADNFSPPSFLLLSQLKLQKDSKIDPSKPKYNLEVSFDKIDIAFNSNHFKCVATMLEYFTNFDRFEKFRKFRPARARPKEDPMRWWNYALECVLFTIHEKKRRTSWKHVFDLLEKRKRYVLLYKRKLQVPWVCAPCAPSSVSGGKKKHFLKQCNKNELSRFLCSFSHYLIKTKTPSRNTTSFRKWKKNWATKILCVLGSLPLPKFESKGGNMNSGKKCIWNGKRRSNPKSRPKFKRPPPGFGERLRRYEKKRAT